MANVCGAAIKVGSAILIVAVFAGPRPAAADPACPEGSRHQVISGAVSKSSGLTTSHPVSMAPCETLFVGFTGATAGPVAVSVKVSLTNSNGVELSSRSSWCYVATGCGFTIPGSSSYSGTPLPGTAGDAGRASTLVVTMGNSAYTTSGVTYVIEAWFNSRPGYNRGSPGIGAAPLLAKSPETIAGSLMYLENGQYYRVRLRAGGTLQVSGQLGITCSPCTGGAFSIAVFNSTGTYIATIGSRGYGSNYGSSVPFTSSVFTNTTGQPAEFVLRLKVGVVPTPTLAEFTLTVTWSEGPHLTLFLDREPNDPTWRFRAEAPESDHATYLPGADRLGSSVPLGEGAQGTAQALELVAAYTDETGAVVSPPPYAPSSVTFALRDTSAFRGFAMNAGENTAPDFGLPTPGAAFGADHTARAALLCHDYGGFTTVSVSDGVQETDGLRLPVALPDDWLPAAGWVAWDGAQVDGLLRSKAQDDDSSPAVVSHQVIPYGLVGDGLTAFEEYRGFVVGGSHRRLDPARKDLFVVGDSDYGVGFATNLPLVVHQIVSVNEHAAGLINSRVENAGNGGAILVHPQKALIVTLDDESFDPGHMGQTEPPMDFRVPLDVESIIVYVQSHLVYLLAPAGYCGQTSEDPPCHSMEQAENELRRTIAHEIGHGVGICHFGECGSVGDATPSTRAPTVMHSGVFLGPPASDDKSKYDPLEQGLIRLHRR